jgi:hypothetical protein
MNWPGVAVSVLLAPASHGARQLGIPLRTAGRSMLSLNFLLN